MKYGSVCSGIEAASVAWEPLGLEPAWFSQFDPEHNYKKGTDFPSAVLAHHWPHVSNLGDMTKLAIMVRSGDVEAPDILVGGTPCQAFSVAGARKGLEDDRGQLTISYGELADAIDDQRIREGKQPSIIVWENVPGVLSSKDNAFGAFLGLLAGEDCELEPPGKKWSNAGYVSGPKRSIAWRTLDAQYFGVAQRRRRVFVVASARADFDPAKVLFEREGVRRDIAPSRSTEKNVAALTANGVGTCGADDNQAQAGHLIPISTSTWPVSHCLNAGGMARIDYETETMVVHGTQEHDRPIACYPINTQLALRGSETSNSTREGIGLGDDGDPIFTLLAAHHHAVATNMQVRRLTPIECERLQGFPDNHTLIPTEKRKQITAEEYAYYRHHNPEMTAEQAYKLAADGPRYKAIGNSMAVPVMAWIGKRIISHLNK
ncbi:hypothetical protein ACO03_11605 [Pantoea ananatis]|nr:hypothetical protein ACO03_11605 [Pantoea ananatis]